MPMRMKRAGRDKKSLRNSSVLLLDCLELDNAQSEKHELGTKAENTHKNKSPSPAITTTITTPTLGAYVYNDVAMEAQS